MVSIPAVVGISTMGTHFCAMPGSLIRHARQMEETLLPEDLPYEEVTGLRIEARQKLMKQRPRSLAAASRIPGVSPADVAVLMVFLEKHKGND